MVCHLRSELRPLPGADEGQEGLGTRGLYPTLLGGSWFELAEPVRAAHAEDRALRARGSLRVEHGEHLLARLIARALCLPQVATAAETQLVVTPGPHGGQWCEHWRRTIGRQSFQSRQYDAGGGELAEHFRLLEFRFRLHVSAGESHHREIGEKPHREVREIREEGPTPRSGGLVFRQVGVFLRFGSLRVRLPGIWSPTVEAREDPAGVRRTHVRVRVVAPLVGLIIGYDGEIEFEDA